MERQFYGSAPCGETEVEYFLLVEAQDAEEYGILVEKGEEQAALPALGRSRERVGELLGRMLRGAVTPISARDVAEDWLLSS